MYKPLLKICVETRTLYSQANAEANRALAAGNKVVGKAKRHTTPQVNRKPFVEYTRGGSEEFGKSNNPIEIPSSPPEQSKNIMVAPPYGGRYYTISFIFIYCCVSVHLSW